VAATLLGDALRDALDPTSTSGRADHCPVKRGLTGGIGQPTG
jgi:hypothetical protein